MAKASSIVTVGKARQDARYVNVTGDTMTGTLTLNGDTFATQGWVTDTLIASAPGTLDTLNELAAALGDDPNFATTVSNSIATKLPLAGGTLTGSLAGTNISGTNLYAQNFYITSSGTSALNRIDNDGSGLYFTYGGTTNKALYISDSTGNTGIGITAPTSKLHVAGDLRVDSGANIDGQLYLGWAGSDSQSHDLLLANQQWHARIRSVGGDLVMTASGDNEKLRTTNDGIRVTGNADIDGYATIGANLKIGSGVADGYYQDASNGAYRANGTSGTKGYYFQSYNGGSTIMYVGLNGTYAGKVGIGTTSPGGALHLNGNFETSKALVIKGTYGTGTEHYFRTHGVNSEDLSIYNNSTRALALNGGNVFAQNNLSVNGNTYLGNSNGDQTHINDTLYLGATDSGDAHMYFGENSSNWYGLYLNWDSGHRVSWYSRHAGTNTRFMYFDTNNTGYLHWSRSFDMNNVAIDYVHQLHFHDNVRFYDDGNDSYLNFKYGDASTGAIRFRKGDGAQTGMLYSDSSGFGLLSADGSWSVRAQNSETRIYHNAYFEGNIYGYTYYDRNDTSYYLNPNGTSRLLFIDMPHRGNGTENLLLNNGGSENWNVIDIAGGNNQNGIGTHATGHSTMSRNGMSLHINSSDSIRFHSSGWDTLLEVAGGTGYGWLKGDLYVNGGQVYVAPINTRSKYMMWGSDTSFAIGMGSGYSYGHIGGTGSEYVMSFQMDNNNNRGFWWGDTVHNNAQGAMSLTTEGRLTVATSLSVGEGEGVTTPSSTPLYVVGSTADEDVLAVDGVNGRLFTVTDSLDDSLFSVNTIAGLPVIEAFADQSIKLGPFTAPVEITSAGELKVDGGTNLGTAVTGATVSNDTITFTRANGSTFAVTTSDANTNYYVNSADFSTANGVLSLSVVGTTDVTVDLDGRYLTEALADARFAALNGDQNQDFAVRELTAQGTVTAGAFVGDGSGLTGISAGSSYPIIITGGSTFLGSYAGVSDNGMNNRNVGIGGNSLTDTTTGFRNTAIGYRSNWLNTTGYENVAVGYDALGSSVSGYWNTAVGAHAMPNADSPASDNTAVGVYAMSYLTTGRYNTALGTYALADTELGSNNVAVGYYAGGSDYQGTNSVYLGMNTEPNSWNETNQVVIGYGAQGNGSNTITFGNTSIIENFFTAGPVLGQDFIPTSDSRLKENIVNSPYGLDAVKQLQAKKYNLIGKEENSIGLIAQEVEPVIPEVVRQSSNGYYGVNYGALVPVLVEAIKELEARVASLEQQLNS